MISIWAIAAETLSVTFLVVLVVLADLAIPRGLVRFDRGAFYLYWPVGAIATRNQTFVREFHVIVFGYEWHYCWIDDRVIRSVRWLSKGQT